MNITTSEALVRLLLGMLLAGAVGFEREARHHEAGLRTHMLVGLGAALFVVTGSNLAGGNDSRVAAQIVTGIGFLGAGVIVRRDDDVKGITTAAGIWTAAAIGMATGLGYFVVATFATILGIAVLVVVELLEQAADANRHKRHRQIQVEVPSAEFGYQILARARDFDPGVHLIGEIDHDGRRFVLCMPPKSQKEAALACSSVAGAQVIELGPNPRPRRLLRQSH